MAGAIRYDVTGSDPDEAEQIQGDFESPRPGQYVAKILEMKKKGSGGDPKKPMLEVVFEMINADKKSNLSSVKSKARMWYYLMLPGHPSFEPGAFVVQKLDQFLLAIGVAGKKSKRKGTFDPDEHTDKEVGLVVRAGTNQEGEYRGEVASVFVYDPETFGQDVEDDDDDVSGLEDEDIEVEDDEDGDVEPYEEWALADLRAELEARELDTKGKRAAMVERLEEDDASTEEEPEEESEEEEEDDEEEGEYDSMSIKELRAELEARDLDVKGTKPTLISRLEDNDENGGEDEAEEEEEEEETKPARRGARKPTARRKPTTRKGKKDDFPFAK